MSIGPTSGIVSSAAGSPLAQASGADAARIKGIAESVRDARRAAELAASADGIAQAEGENLLSNERDPDGRQAWQASPQAVEDSQEVGDPGGPPKPPRDGEHLFDASG
jgi:hypothetical protein